MGRYSIIFFCGADYSISSVGIFHGSSDKPRVISLQQPFLLPYFFLVSPRCRSISFLNRRWLFLFRSHILLLQDDGKLFIHHFHFPKTDGEKGCRLKIGTVPSWRKTFFFYFGPCKWVLLFRNDLGTVPKI